MGRSISAVQPLEANKDELVMPTFGALAGDDFYFIANSQRDVYAADGKPMDGVLPEDRAIYQVSARYAWQADSPVGEMRSIPGKQ